MRGIYLIALLTILSGCAHSIHQVHTSDFSPGTPVESGDMVKATSEQFVVLGFVGQTDYVNEAYAKLQAGCPDGRLTAITTEYSTALGFFSWTNKIRMQGLCLKPKG